MFACLLLRDSARDRKGAAAALIALAQDFSPRFEVVSPRVVLVDVSGLGRLVGDAEAVSAAIDRLARARALDVTVVLAPTRTAALLLALASVASTPAASRARPAPRVIAPGMMAKTLAPLPALLLATLSQLETGADVDRPPARRTRPSVRRTRGSGRNYRLAPSPAAAQGATAAASAKAAALDPHAPLSDLLQTLQRWGVHTLGAFAALPAIDLFERLGGVGLYWQSAARGEDARPLVRTTPEAPFEVTAALEWPVETLEPLSFVLTGLLEPLCQRLARAERGAAALQTTLQLVTRTEYTRRLELPAPMRDVKVLRTLILLDLESHPPDAGIDRVTVTIEPTPARVLQHSLLVRARPSPEQVATLTARLTAVLGEARVGAPALVDSYAPGAFVLQPFDGDVAAADPPRHDDRPGEDSTVTGFVLRRFRQRAPARVERVRGRPVHVSVRTGGVRGGRVLQAAGPWRTSGAWWNAADAPQGADDAGVASTPWDRDEWDVVIAGGTALRLSRDRRSKAWFVDGLLD